jgi:hypothetical protein
VSDLAAWDILKWVLLVLLAGFIGQFGRSFAQTVQARLRRKKEEAAVPSAPAGPSRTGGADASGEPAVPGTVGQVPVRPPVPGAVAETKSADAQTDKKAQKALAKQQKKEEKLRLKNEKKQ